MISRLLTHLVKVMIVFSSKNRRPMFDSPRPRIVRATAGPSSDIMRDQPRLMEMTIKRTKTLNCDFMSGLADAFDEIAGARMDPRDMRARWYKSEFRDMMINTPDCVLDDYLIVQLSSDELQKYVSVQSHAGSDNYVQKHQMSVARAVDELRRGIDAWSSLQVRVKCHDAWNYLINEIATITPLSIDEKNMHRTSVPFIAALGRHSDVPHIRELKDTLDTALLSNKSRLRNLFNRASYDEFVDASMIMNPFEYCRELDTTPRDVLKIVLYGLRTQSSSVMESISCPGVNKSLFKPEHAMHMTVDDIESLLCHSNTMLFNQDTTIVIFERLGRQCSESLMRRVMYRTSFVSRLLCDDNEIPSWDDYCFKVLEHALRLNMLIIAEDVVPYAINASSLIMNASLDMIVYMITHGMQPSMLSSLTVTSVDDFITFSNMGVPLNLMQHQYFIDFMTDDDFRHIISRCDHYLTLNDLLTINITDSKFEILMTSEAHRLTLLDVTADKIARLPNKHFRHLRHVITMIPPHVTTEALEMLSVRRDKPQLLINAIISHLYSHTCVE